MSRVGIVINPKGQQGRLMKIWQKTQSHFPSISDESLFHTTGSKDGTNQARAALNAGCKTIIAVGGDGTVSEVAQALIGTEAHLAAIPIGTGNDFARTFGIPMDPILAMNIALEGEPKKVDVCLSSQGSYCVNLAGCGFDAEVMTRFNHPPKVLRRAPTKIRYYFSIFQTFASYKGVGATIEWDGNIEIVDNLLLLATGCAQYYGAGMHIIPMADPTDGILDIVWGADIRLAQLNKLMSQIYKGTHIHDPHIQFRKARKVSIKTSPSTKLHIDGDVIGETPATFECVPSALNLVCP